MSNPGWNYRARLMWYCVVIGCLLGWLATQPHTAYAAHDCVAWHDTNVEFIIDYSGSMSDDGGWKAALARNFAVGVLDGLSGVGHLERAGGLGFPGKYDLGVTAQNRVLLRNAILSTLSDGASTPLYDAIFLGAAYVENLSLPGRTLLVVITDGEEDGTSFAGYNEAMLALQNSNAWNYLVFAGNAGDPGHVTLESLAIDSGSEFQRADSSTAVSTLVSEVLAQACRNFRPHAGFVLSDAELQLGIEGNSITFDGSTSTDAETGSGGLSFAWTFTRPDGSSYTRTGRTTVESFTDAQLHNGESWQARLQVTDGDGASDTASRTFRVTGSPPEITLSGTTYVQVGDPIQLHVTPTVDTDGGSLTIAWTIVQQPPQATSPPLPDGPSQTLPTTSTDIGTWVFRATATDNEGNVDRDEIMVEVANIPPEIDLMGGAQVRLGDVIQVETMITADEDGGDLSFRWDIIQAPQSARAHLPVQEGYHQGIGAAGSVLTIQTVEGDAGHWIFRLVATDDDNAVDSETSAEFRVLVDASPQAEIAGPMLIGSSAFPLVLDGSGSVDLDSPCPDQPDRCHDTLDGRMVEVPDDPLRYTWALVDVPAELWESYTVGTADDALGLYAHDSTLSIDYGLLEPGDWTFELEVIDGEGNRHAETLTVAITDENGHPTAIVNGPTRYVVSSGNVLSRDIILSGLASYDRDNILTGASLSDGLGITRYDWELLQIPPGCTPPALPAGPNAGIFTLYAAGDVIDPSCQGVWRIQLTVTDDDPSPVTDFAETLIGIGNCPQVLCIDSPTTALPRFVEFAQGTRIDILYHVDSSVYDVPELLAGLVVRLAIYHESDLDTPVYTVRDPNVLATDRGGQLVFEWNGRDGNESRPRPGRYTVELELLDAQRGAIAFSTVERNAIAIQFVAYRIGPQSDDLVSYDGLRLGQETVTIHYDAWGGLTADTLRWHVYDASRREVYTGTAPPQSGVIEWDGRIAPDTTIGPGHYQVELEPIRHGVAVGATTSHTLTIFQTTLNWGPPLQIWQSVWNRRDPAELLIVTTPPITSAQLIELGFPLKLHTDLTPITGVTMNTLVGPDTPPVGMFIPPPATGLAPFPTAIISDTSAGVLLTFASAITPTMPLVGEQDTQDEFASSDDAVSTPATSNHSDGDAFDLALARQDWRQVGKARDHGDYTALQPPANRAFVIHAGTEPLWFSLWGVTTPKRQVRQQADWFYYSGHGQLRTGELLLPDGGLSAANVHWGGDLEVVIIAGCSVLGIKDYRARSFGPASYAEWLAASNGGTASPGEQWEDSGPDYLLGYGWSAPLDTQGTEAILQDFFDAVSAGHDVVTAWGMANDPAVNPTGSNAVVIDTSQTPHRYCYWDEQSATAVWTCIEKTNGAWPNLP